MSLEDYSDAFLSPLHIDNSICEDGNRTALNEPEQECFCMLPPVGSQPYSQRTCVV